MLDYLRKHTIVIMAAMALVFVGLMFVGGDVSGGSLTGMFKQTFVSVDGKSYGEKDYNNMGRTGLSVAFSFPSTFGPLLQDNFSSEENLRELCHLLKTNNPNAAFLAYRGIIRREAGRLGLTDPQRASDKSCCQFIIPDMVRKCYRGMPGCNRRKIEREFNRSASAPRPSAGSCRNWWKR